MKKDEFVALGLDDETARKCAAASAEELKNFIPKERFDEVNREKKRLEQDVRDRDAQLETLKNDTGDVDNMKQRIAELQAENQKKDADHAAEIKQLKVDAAISAALTGAKARNEKAVRALLTINMEKIKVKADGSLEGFDLTDQLKELQKAEDSKFLFEESKPAKFRGIQPGETGVEPADNGVDIAKMSYEELAAYMEQNPDARI